jgi:hypothetical protein
LAPVDVGHSDADVPARPEELERQNVAAMEEQEKAKLLALAEGRTRWRQTLS